MSAKWNLDWKGKGVQDKLLQATKDGIDTTMAAGVEEAKIRVNVRTGILQGSIRFEPARQEGARVVGRWGSFDVNYAIPQELGPNGRPYLRPASDLVYPLLAENIKGALD